jgi:Na/Pi-cotransporter
MDFFNFLTLLGGLSLFLFGMTIMGSALEKRAGGSLKKLLGKLTANRMTGFLTGLGVTAVIQSSSATTVMVVGFVNSGIMTLKQAINVIIGANVGTTVTAWILSLTGIDSANVFVKLLKPSSFTPIVAAIGLILYMAAKTGKKKDIGLVMLGFATLMFGMESMSGAVSGLRNVPEFQNIFVMFTNPIFGVLAGAGLTAIIQSSSASVGILQALSSTGQVTYSAAIPIIMGQNIGTCVTALISAVGANKNGKRTAVVHLMFNVIGTVVWLTVFTVLNAIFKFAFVNDAANQLGIAIAHTTFNVLCTAIMLPATGLLDRLAHKIVPDGKSADSISELDERLMATPSIAIDRCRIVTETMAQTSCRAVKNALVVLDNYNAQIAAAIREDEEAADKFEDILGTYLVHLSSHAMTEQDSEESAKLLRMIGDLERISDHAVHIVESVEETREKEIVFTDSARAELRVISNAVAEILDLATECFIKNDTKTAELVEPLEQVVDTLRDQLRSRHIFRLQKGDCSIEAGFVWSDLLTNLSRVADHCSNIAGSVIEMSHASLDLHEYLGGVKAGSPDFISRYNEYAQKYALVTDSLPELNSKAI